MPPPPDRPPTAPKEAWLLVEADPVERVMWPNLDAVLAQAAREPVAPPNRWRKVCKVAGPDGRSAFLKQFARTQLKNRIRNALTAPRCRSDAEREVAIAQALTAHGFAAPRVIGVGRRGRASFCLLAEVAGDDLRSRIASGRCDRVLADRVAAHCGAIGAAGITLPDLSADHVFVDGEDARSAQLTVIDLHRGSEGRPRRRDLVRVLRAFGRSIRGLTVPRRAALRFAVILVRATASGVGARAAVERLPPLDTHGRYDVAARAARYGKRDPRRARREIELLLRVWPGRAGEEVLDIPCGRGRLAPVLGELGARWHGADLSTAMLDAARGTVAGAPLSRAEATKLPFASGSFDGVIAFRFLHHLPDVEARMVCHEIARVGARFVVVTFFHPVSVHALTRRLASILRGRAKTRHTRTLARVDAWFRERGYERRARAAQAPFVRDLWIASYERRVSGT